MTRNDHLEAIAQGLDQLRTVSLITPAMVEGLSPVDQRTRQAGLLGANEAGLFKPVPRT
jgi:hypothetical protein